MGLRERKAWLRKHRKKPTVSGRENLPRPEYLKLVRDLRTRCDNRCENVWCKTRSILDPHHVQKRSQGGPDVPDNIVMLCRFCHANTDLDHNHGRWLGVEAHLNETFTFTIRRAAQALGCDIQINLTTYHMRYIRPKTEPINRGGVE